MQTGLGTGRVKVAKVVRQMVALHVWNKEKNSSNKDLYFTP